MSGVDWGKVELDYRTGILSVGTICRVHGITRHRLMDKVASDGWSRDLMSQVRLEANERLYMAREREIETQDHVTIAAQVIVDVVHQHRRDISQLRSTWSDAVARVRDLMSSDVTLDVEDKQGLILRQLQMGLFLGKSAGVVSALDALASTYERIVALERSAFGLDALIGTDIPNPNATSANVGGAQVTVYIPDNSRDVHRPPVTIE